MHTKRFTLLALVILFAAVTARADNTDDFIKAEMQRQHIPGLSLAVVKDGKILKVEGYGLANVELNVPAKGDTVYKIGSVSKQFIAAGVLLLVEEGRISLDDHIGKFLEGTPDTWKDITVRHLLTHTSGIVREAPGFDPLKIQPDADVIKTAYPLPLRFAPGEKWEYCNVGYFSLAEIIRKVSGKPWPDYLRERVFAPLDMNATRTTTITDLVPNRANGYEWRNNKLQNSEIYFALRPSGALLSTVLDLAKWDAALYTEKILKEATKTQMWTPVKLNNGKDYDYGFGWEVSPLNKHRRVNHGGSLPGFRSQITRFLDDRLTVIVLTNSDNASPGPIATGVAALYITGLVPTRAVAKVAPEALEPYAGKYQPNPNLTLTIAREGEKLVLQQGDEKMDLLPENETTFFTRSNLAITYRFERDESGRVTYLVLHRDGSEVGRAKKIN